MAITQPFKFKTMCNKPIKIKNPSKYINTKEGGQPYYIWINCGHCKECITQKQNEWNLRTFYKYLDCINSGGWVYFDTLTYRNDTLPRLTQFIEYNKNWQCFRPEDIREFYERLRGWYGDKSFDYLIVSEYGETRKRVHYHILLFVYDITIDKYEFSRNVAKAWGKGRTDGLPYRSKKYVKEHNILTNMNLDVIKYVVKYITKSIIGEQHILERWNKIEHYLKHHEKHKYNKLEIKKIKRTYLRHTMPFHRQSRGHGLTALLYMDYEQLKKTNKMYFKDGTINILSYCHIPMYFKRKLWQKQIKYNGKRIWINNDEGIKVKLEQEEMIYKKILDRLNDLNKQHEKQYKDILPELAKYILFERGRFKGKPDYKPRHDKAEYFNYQSDRDLKYLGKKGISKNFIGNDTIGYLTTEYEPIENIEEKVYINNEFEKALNDLMIEKDTTTLMILKEHMREIKKIFFQNY